MRTESPSPMEGEQLEVLRSFNEAQLARSNASKDYNRAYTAWNADPKNDTNLQIFREARKKHLETQVAYSEAQLRKLQLEGAEEDHLAAIQHDVDLYTEVLRVENE